MNTAQRQGSPNASSGSGRDEAPPSAGGPRSSRRASHKGKTILLVDDSETVRKVISVYLMGRDLDFLEADEGERALNILRLVSVDLMVVDINMPNVDGLELIRRVRAGEAGDARIPILVVTGDQAADMAHRARDVGADAFLHKPLDGPTVVDVVDRLLLTRSQ